LSPRLVPEEKLLACKLSLFVPLRSAPLLCRVGLNVRKKTISYWVKDGSGHIHAEGTIPARRWDLHMWMKTLPQPWTAAMEATTFTLRIYDPLLPHAAAVKVAHPLWR
jgi:hypothetical protein